MVNSVYESSKYRKIRSITGNTIDSIVKSGESERKAIQANLRNSIGREVDYVIGTLPVIMENIPEDMLSTNGSETDVERVLLNVLQLYAISSQGYEQIEPVEPEEKKKIGNVGDSIRQLRRGENTVALDRRFNAMVASDDYDEVIVHLRHLFKLLKSKGELKIDFIQLSEDLLKIKNGKERNILMRWARRYYAYQNKQSGK